MQHNNHPILLGIRIDSKKNERQFCRQPIIVQQNIICLLASSWAAFIISVITMSSGGYRSNCTIAELMSFYFIIHDILVVFFEMAPVQLIPNHIPEQLFMI